MTVTAFAPGHGPGRDRYRRDQAAVTNFRWSRREPERPESGPDGRRGAAAKAVMHWHCSESDVTITSHESLPGCSTSLSGLLNLKVQYSSQVRTGGP